MHAHDPAKAVRMVRLITVSTGFEAKVIAARLGVEGILWELRGGVDGPYPIGPVHVFVAEQDLSFARQVLLESEVESAFHEPRARSTRLQATARWMLVASLAVMMMVTFGRLFTLR
jgi:hypothetical protein